MDGDQKRDERGDIVTSLGLKVDEPDCCNAPMVHNSASGMYECADAYFALVDDGVIGDCGDVAMEALDRCACSNCQSWQMLLAHWRASFVPDGWDDQDQGRAD